VLLSRILKGNNDPANEEDTNRRRRRTRRRTIEIFVLFLDHWIHDDDEDCTASPNAPTGIDEAISCCRFVRFPAKHVVNGGGGGGGGGGGRLSLSFSNTKEEDDDDDDDFSYSSFSLFFSFTHPKPYHPFETLNTWL